MNHILQTEDGEYIPSTSAKEYIKWCISEGYEDLYSCPEYNEYLKTKSKKKWKQKNTKTKQ